MSGWRRRPSNMPAPAAQRAAWAAARAVQIAELAAAGWSVMASDIAEADWAANAAVDWAERAERATEWAEHAAKAKQAAMVAAEAADLLAEVAKQAAAEAGTR